MRLGYENANLLLIKLAYFVGWQLSAGVEWILVVARRFSFSHLFTKEVEEKKKGKNTLWAL
jgi:hypothetical protein